MALFGFKAHHENLQTKCSKQSFQMPTKSLSVLLQRVKNFLIGLTKSELIQYKPSLCCLPWNSLPFISLIQRLSLESKLKYKTLVAVHRIKK